MSAMVSRLVVGDHDLPIYVTRWGPALGADDRRTEPLVMLLNAAAAGESKLVDAIEHGGLGSNELVWVEPTATAPNEVAVVRAVGVEDENLVGWSELRRAVGELRRLKATWTPPPSPWLFTADPVSGMTTFEEEDLLRAFEVEAEAVDDADAHADVGREPAALIDRRRRLLTAADSFSLFDRHRFVGDFGDARDNALRAIHATAALSLRRAGLGLRDLGAVDDGASVLSGPVCIDFLRLNLWPAGDGPATWMSRAIPLLDPDAEGDQGVVVERVGDAQVRVYWRRDAARPALLAVAAS